MVQSLQRRRTFSQRLRQRQRSTTYAQEEPAEASVGPLFLLIVAVILALAIERLFFNDSIF